MNRDGHHAAARALPPSVVARLLTVGPGRRGGDVVAAFWDGVVAATGIDGPYETWAFGDPSLPDLATELAMLVRDGPKRATAGLASDYEDDTEPMPKVGDLSGILDGVGAPVCVIRTTDVTIRRLADVDEAFAWDEGEGDRTLAWWRRAYEWYFEKTEITVDDDTPMVPERVELLWPGPPPYGS